MCPCTPGERWTNARVAMWKKQEVLLTAPGLCPLLESDLVLATNSVQSPFSPGADGARPWAVFYDRDELETALILQVLMVFGSLSCKMNCLPSLTFISLSIKALCGRSTTVAQGPDSCWWKYTPCLQGVLRNTAGAPECSHTWGAL